MMSVSSDVLSRTMAQRLLKGSLTARNFFIVALLVTYLVLQRSVLVSPLIDDFDDYWEKLHSKCIKFFSTEESAHRSRLMLMGPNGVPQAYSVDVTGLEVVKELVVLCIGDSITFGNASHDSPLRWNTRPTRYEGSYPLELRSLLSVGNENRDRIDTKRKPSDVNDKSLLLMTENPYFDRMVVYNFGVTGTTASAVPKFSYRDTREFGSAKALFGDVTKRSHNYTSFRLEKNFDNLIGREFRVQRFGGNRMLLPNQTVLGEVYAKSLTPGVCSPTFKKPQVAGVANRQQQLPRPRRAKTIHTRPPAVHRTVLLILMFGTNDSKEGLWSGKEAFMRNYTSLMEEFMLPNLFQGDAKEGEEVKAADANDPVTEDRLEISIISMSPLPAFPDPRVRSKGKGHMLVGIQGHVLLDGVRSAVKETFMAFGRSVANRITAPPHSVLLQFHHFDLFDQFTQFVVLPAIGSDSRKKKVEDLLMGKAQGELSMASYEAFMNTSMKSNEVKNVLHDGVHPRLASHSAIASLLYNFLAERVL